MAPALERGKHHEQLAVPYYEIDIPTCHAISRNRGKTAGERCYASAAQRYGNGIAGRPISPLDTTEMTENILELHAFLEDGGKRKPLHIKVSVPAKTQGQQDYFCLVHAPLVLGQDRRIFGLDPDQARSLAVGFIKSLLENKKVVDGDGKPVSL